MLKATPGAMGKEAVQEFVQEFLGTLNSYVNDPAAGLLTEENLSQYANAAAAGAAAGFLFGGLEGASSYRADKAEAQGVVEEVAEEEAEEDPFADIPEAEAEEVLNNAWEGAEKLSGEIRPLSEEDEKK